MDQESRDANNLLVELDRGLLSPNIGDQSEAVVRFTRLFQRYPLPILINSACLKLAEAFRCGSNFIRVQICELLERNQSHLDKIYNVDDFFRNLFTVTTSNDPIARSITLLTLGNIAPIVSEYKSIHHCISSSLESTVECELNATIACAACYVKQSAEFACNIYPKIVSIVDSDKSSNDMKIRALSVLDHGFYNANDAMTVSSFLIEVIGKAKLKKLICTCLTLSTKIAYTSLSHIMPQIELLIGIFLNESHKAVKMNALRNLRFLAEKSPHIWETSHVEPLVSHLESRLRNGEIDEDDQVVCTILSIFCKLLACKCNFISQQEKTRIFRQCYKLALDNHNVALCSMAFELITVMSEEHFHSSSKSGIEYQSSDLTTDTFKAIQTFLNNSSPSMKTSRSKTNQQQVNQISKLHSSKSIYRHIVRLCNLNPHYCQDLLKLTLDKISNKDTVLSELSPYVTEMLCAINETSSTPMITSQCWKLIKKKGSDMSETNLLNLCVLHFQFLRQTHPNHVAISQDDILDEVIRRNSLWFGFKLLRQAMRYGLYNIAKSICHELHEHVTTDTTDFYFKSLGRICIAEALILQSDEIDENLRKSLECYEEAVSPLRASIGNLRTTNFQLQFLELRIRNLHVHSNLRQCCKTYEASPITYTALLNAIGATRSSGVDNSLTRLGTIQQMPKIAKDFRYLAEGYENLSVVSFNCDDRTLAYINLLKSSCIIMADVIDAVFQYGKNLPVISKLSPCAAGTALEHRQLENTCNKLIELIRAKVLKPGISPSLETIEPLISLLKTFSDEIVTCPFVYPRYFFQPLQMTQIKLAITPQPSSTSNYILNHNLVLKVEGLIENLSKKDTMIRQVSKVVISVSMILQKATGNSTLELNTTIFVQSTATPHNNYFKTDFLLPLKRQGIFSVDINASIIDEHERIWKTGPTENLQVVVS